MSLVKFWNGQTPEDQRREREAEWEQRMLHEFSNREQWMLILRPEDLQVPPMKERIEIWKQANYPNLMRP